MEPLTRRQLDVLHYVADVTSSRGASPTLREIADAFGVGVPSVQRYLRALRLKGFVSIRRYARRGIHLTRSRRDWKLRRGWRGDFDRRIGERLRGPLDLPLLFEIVRDPLRAWLDVDRCDLFVLDPHGKDLRDAAFFGVAPVGSVTPPGPAEGRIDAIVRETFRRRRPTTAAVAAGSGTEDPKSGKTADCAAVPILGRNRVTGVLRLEKRRRAAGLDEATMTRAAMAAAALAQPLDQAALHGELERRTRLQAALAALYRTIHSPGDFRGILRDVHGVVGGFVDSPVFLIAVKDDGDQWWMLLETDTVDGVRIENTEPRPITIGHHEALRAIRTHSYWIRHRTPEEIRHLEAQPPTDDPRQLGMIGHMTKRSRSILFAPLKREGEMIGYLSAQSYAYNAYTIRDAEDLILVGEYIGMAAQNALRAEIARRRRTGEEDRIARVREELGRIADTADGRTWRARLRSLAEELTAPSSSRNENPPRSSPEEAPGGG